MAHPRRVDVLEVLRTNHRFIGRSYYRGYVSVLWQTIHNRLRNNKNVETPRWNYLENIALYCHDLFNMVDFSALADLAE